MPAVSPSSAEQPGLQPTGPVDTVATIGALIAGLAEIADAELDAALAALTENHDRLQAALAELDRT